MMDWLFERLVMMMKMKKMMMELKGVVVKSMGVDLVMVTLGLLVMGVYHVWLLRTILRCPNRTVIGLNALARKRWVRAMISDPMKNGVLAVQTIRNNIMASTVLATTAITLSSLISVFVGVTTTTTNSVTLSSMFFPPNNPDTHLASIKFLSISLCFLLAFLCNVQSIRYYAHVSFLLTTPANIEGGGGGGGGAISLAYVTRNLNHGCFFWSLGMRAFYVSFTLFLWIFGPVFMFVSCVVMCSLLYFLDTASESARDIHDLFNGEV
ncbi:hypothetical protein IHE45_04G082500 [Dioscorea alata]|uniref:Uncharacterized protein n=1 Tax=Dioscorea alata TaxID=55571 RepID=A0ACB7WE57_DIOAL|nr:hypothetical protein IHE45_04G082500 [Dioscorea alata]